MIQIGVPSITGVKLAAFFSAYFLAFGIYLPFFPVWLASSGLSESQIGLVLAAPVVRIVAGPAIAFLCDRAGSRKMPIVLLCAGTLAGFSAYGMVDSFGAIVVVSVFIAVFWTSILPIVESLTVSLGADGDVDYGRVRLWGSLAFIAGSLVAGHVLASVPSQAVLFMLVACQVLLFAAALALPDFRSSGKGPGSVATPSWRDARQVLVRPAFLVFLFAAGLSQAGHALYYVAGTIHWKSAGLASTQIGILWSVGVAAEIVLFMFAGGVLKRLSPVSLLVAGAAATVVRWGLTAFVTDFPALFAIQVLHGLTFGAAHLGALYFIARSVPTRLQATAQGTYSAVSSGLLLSGAVALSGPAYEALGGQAYLLMSAMGAVAVILALVLGRMNTVHDEPDATPTVRGPEPT